MIARLQGTIAEKQADRLTLDVAGVGYDVLIPLSTYYELGEEGQSARLLIHTHVKEDVLSLYGFLTPREKKLFRMLIQISGVGPKLGIAILSGLPPDEFAVAVQSGDLRRIVSIPGVGKKTAERLILEMRDKLADWTAGDGARDPAFSPSGLQSDVVSALVNLGYSKADAEKRTAAALQRIQTDRFDVLLKASLNR